MNQLSEKEERVWAMLCHFGVFGGNLLPFGHIIIPLVVWLIRRNESPFVDHHGKESVNFQISMTIYLFLAGILTIILVGFAFLLILWIFNMVVVVIAGVRASGGEWYRYPATIRFIK